MKTNTLIAQNTDSEELTVDVKRKPSIKLVLIPAGFFVILLISTYVYLSSYSFFTHIWKVITVIGTMIVGYMYISRVTTTYAITPLEATVSQGIFSRSVSSAPLNRITNFEMRRPFIKRIIGLADLFIATAGTADIELKMMELNKDDAERIRQFLTVQLGQQKVSDAGTDQELRRARQDALDRQIKDPSED